jgi:hypothetical protein
MTPYLVIIIPILLNIFIVICNFNLVDYWHVPETTVILSTGMVFEIVINEVKLECICTSTKTYLSHKIGFKVLNPRCNLDLELSMNTIRELNFQVIGKENEWNQVLFS